MVVANGSSRLGREGKMVCAAELRAASGVRVRSIISQEASAAATSKMVGVGTPLAGGRLDGSLSP